MRNKVLVVAVLSIILVLAGCASTSGKKAEESLYPTSLGDFSPFELGDAISLWKSGSDVSPCEMKLYCIPRTNKIEIHFSKAINKVCLMMDAEDCAGFVENVEKYMADYNSGHFDKNYKPTKKN
nr:hypothetical protein [Treponemataceae bacterium]